MSANPFDTPAPNPSATINPFDDEENAHTSSSNNNNDSNGGDGNKTTDTPPSWMVTGTRKLDDMNEYPAAAPSPSQSSFANIAPKKSPSMSAKPAQNLTQSQAPAAVVVPLGQNEDSFQNQGTEPVTRETFARHEGARIGRDHEMDVADDDKPDWFKSAKRRANEMANNVKTGGRKKIPRGRVNERTPLSSSSSDNHPSVLLQVKPKRSFRLPARWGIAITVAISIALWCIEITNAAQHHSYSHTKALVIHPRDHAKVIVSSIAVSPFLHRSILHLVVTQLAFLPLGALCLCSAALPLCLVWFGLLWWGGGALVWCAGFNSSSHLGMDCICGGLVATAISFGVATRKGLWLVASVGVIAVQGIVLSAAHGWKSTMQWDSVLFGAILASTFCVLVSRASACCGLKADNDDA